MRSWGHSLSDMSNRLVLAFAIAATAATSTRAQTPADSLRQYELDVVVITTDVASGTFESVHKIGPAELAQIQPTSAEDALGHLPSARVQTNSRGETLVYLRNNGERQVAVFLDGAPLNVAWDNRVDLSLVPSGAIGSYAAVTGPASVLLGTNVVGGAVELISRTPDGTNTLELEGSVGNSAFFGGIGRALLTVSGWQIAATAEHSVRDGIPLPADSRLPFNQSSGDIRTNTDRTLTSAHVRVQRKVSASHEVGVTLVANAGEKGVAPESHIDPDVGGIRYWRYPNTDRAMLIASSRWSGERIETESSVWVQRFSQTIDDYSGSTYELLQGSQRDRDRSVGGRMVARMPLSAQSSLRGLLLYTANSHTQTDRRPGEDVTREFRQDVFSVGSEYELRPTHRTSYRVGAALDGYHAPGTGIEGAAGVDISATLGVHYSLGGATSLRAGLARKVRFPTARESQDTGLGRFVLNPDLKPESTLLAEASVQHRLPGGIVSVTPFASRTTDTIDQSSLVIDSTRYRMRVNLEGSYVLGVELEAAQRLTGNLTADASFTTMHTRGHLEGVTVRLAEKPATLAIGGLTYRPLRGLLLGAQIRYTGRAYSPDADGELAALPRAAMLDFRVAQTLYLSGLRSGMEIWCKVENLLDTFSMPQMGLPGPGRFARFGVSLVI